MYVIIMSRTSLRVNLLFVVCLNVKELLARSRHHTWSLSDSNGIPTHNHLVPKWTLNHLAKLISSRIAQTKNIYGICWPKRCILFNSIIWKSSKKIACMSNDCGPRIFTKISKVTFFCSQKNRFFVCRICWSFISTGG